MQHIVLASAATLAVDWADMLQSFGGAFGKAVIVMIVVAIGGFLIDTVAKFISKRM
ncbi:hypothetical protein [Bifidobacterium olomucense]|uniref:Uncharacterized protein n=1 Tax=Bifidobacterium olomucense TaxID=2675324 RepID=A0A7Y0HXL3_9BIFI|nr:hypothetical protein [Bifidobacterium sp. DSM 109959]NMM98417.1 hypothetical protein [Bifidobacterium sp. DSM 109959]